jgi:hypothetical protein
MDHSSRRACGATDISCDGCSEMDEGESVVVSLSGAGRSVRECR